MKIRKYSGTAAIISLLLCASLFLMSCGISTSAANDSKDKENTPGFTDEELEQIKEAIEEENEIIDYDNAQIGAELHGYMPSFLCTDTDNYVKIEVTNTSDFTWR
ncbi:MAG TPA: hypothetical protein DCP02_04855, partial [Actinobacteria bacterium]|nr:hypothetical protein [Actinomycetota bacterium]